MFEGKLKNLYIIDIFFKNENHLVLILSDTCSYIDRLGSVDSPRPRNHPFEAGVKFNPLSLFTLVANTATSSIRAELFGIPERIFFRSTNRAFVM